MNEKKKTTSCKKLGNPFENSKANMKTTTTRTTATSSTGRKNIADMGNVRSASLPSVYTDDADEDKAVKGGAQREAFASSSSAASATGNAATAWEIPASSGKKRKQKSKQRRNTQTITMEGAQVDSSQLYQAVCSYNPILFSHSGRSTEELSLVEGDVVKPLTNVDSTGYLYAQVCGNKGLVPAAYLIPLNKAAASHEHVTTGENIDNNAPNDAPSNAPSNAPVNHALHDNLPIIDAKHKDDGCAQKQELPSAGQPHSPSKVFVQRVLSDFSILLGWVMPPMDEFGFSNGVQVKGYRIFVNDVLVDVVPSAMQTKILVDSASFPKRPYKDFGSDYICFKVVATSVGGIDSPASTCILEVGLGTMKSEGGSDVIGALKGGEPIAALTPGEQPLTESEATASEVETGVADFRSSSKALTSDSALTSSLTAMTTSLTELTSSLASVTTPSASTEGKRRRRPHRPPSPTVAPL